MRHLPLFPTLAGAILLAGGCATSPASHSTPGKPGAPSQKFDLQALVDRELPKPLPKARVSVFKGALTGQIEAAGAIKTEDGKLGEDGEAATLEVPLGTGGDDITCYLYPDGRDTADSISKVLAGAGKAAHFERVRLVDVAVVQETAVVYVEADYSATSEGQRVFGQFKLMMSDEPDHPVLCMHDEVGYRASFRRIATGFIESLRPAKPSEPARYTELQLVRLGDTLVGFQQQTIHDGDKGLRIISNRSSLFLPRSPSQLAFTDEALAEVADPRGNLVFSNHATLENGELITSIDVERLDERRYSFKGKRAGKEVSGTFRGKGKGGLRSALAIAEALRAGQASRSPELSIEEYHPRFDTTKPVEVVYRRGEGRHVTISRGGLNVDALIDEHGFVEQAELPLAGTRLRFQRVFVRGAP
jgi:hypothetical protein